LVALLAKHTAGAEVWAYGSRVNGRSHDGSDRDLVVRNPPDLNQGFRGLVWLREALAESDLPILVDVQDWARLPGEMRREVERAHVVLQDPPALTPAG
jgi:uncharacterized protein